MTVQDKAIGEEITVKGDFQYCTTNTKLTLLDAEDACSINKKQEPSIIGLSTAGTWAHGFYILRRLTHEVTGSGYECRKEKQTFRYSTNMLNKKTKTMESEIIKLSSNACWNMINTKTCVDKPMECESSNCWYDEKPLEEYSWWDTIIKVSYICSFRVRAIEAVSRNAVVFNTAANCRADKLECRMHESLIVWKDSVIQKCPYERVGKKTSMVARENIVYSKTDELLFQILDKVDICGMTSYTTSEGLLLTTDSKASNLKLKTDDLTAIHDLIIADLNAANYSSLLLYRQTQMEACKLALMTLRVFSKMGNKLIRIKDSHENDVIVYANGGNLFYPTCVPINELKLTESETCYDEIAVTFEMGNTTYRAFMSTDRIIYT